MEPDQNQNTYEFIMNSGAAPKRSWLPGGSKKQKIVIVGIAAAILLFIFGLIFTLVFSGNNATAEQTLKLAQQHKELLRIAEIGIDKARSSSAKNLSTTVKLTLQSSEDQITAIAKKDQKVSNAQLSGGKNTKVDDALIRAEQNNRFDEAITETLHAQIRSYLTQVKKVHDASSSKKDKQTLTDLYNQLSKLLPAQSS